MSSEVCGKGEFIKTKEKKRDERSAKINENLQYFANSDFHSTCFAENHSLNHSPTMV